jgi:ADP-heptose:LPS heptosyltransferase
MVSMKFPANEIKRIGVFRALQLGDLLCSIPAIRALRNAYPEAEITLLGLPWAKSLLSRFPDYFDAFMHFAGYPGLPEQKFDPRRFADFLHEMLDKKFDLVLQMQGNGSIVNPMIELFGSRHTAGFFLKNDYCPNRQSYLEYPEGYHEVERHLQLVEYLGIDSCGTQLEFPLYESDHEALRKSGLVFSPKEYVCVHPGSRGVYRQWPPEYFAALADYCVEQNLKVVLTGTSDELSIVEEVIQNMEYEPVVAAGKTSIGAAAALIENAFALISNCTGVSHIAAALETPSIVISMDGEPDRWGPMNKQLHRTIDWTQAPEFNIVLNELKHLFLHGPEGDHLRNEEMIAGENIVNGP